LTQELWGSGEVSQKRHQILELIQILNYNQTKKERAEQKQQKQDNEISMEPAADPSAKEVEKMPSPPPPKRRKEEAGGRSFDSRVDALIELD
jgi:hypothetical protein